MGMIKTRGAPTALLTSCNTKKRKGAFGPTVIRDTGNLEQSSKITYLLGFEGTWFNHVKWQQKHQQMKLKRSYISWLWREGGETEPVVLQCRVGGGSGSRRRTWLITVTSTHSPTQAALGAEVRDNTGQ